MEGSRFCYGFTGPKRFRGFRERGPAAVLNIIWFHNCHITITRDKVMYTTLRIF